jgi:uncharacterized protein (DUF427 family)
LYSVVQNVGGEDAVCTVWYKMWVERQFVQCGTKCAWRGCSLYSVVQNVGGEDAVCTVWYKRNAHFCMANIQRHNMCRIVTSDATVESAADRVG